MKTVVHENIDIENFQCFFTVLKRDHPEVLGSEWDKEKQRLKIFYRDDATEIAEEDIRNLKIPTTLRFRKKVEAPKIDASNVLVSALNENEFIVETFDADAVRKEIEKKFVEFEESNGHRRT